LRLIDLEGENAAYIEEIIRLSKRYHFVTPYTSFLAAPRALLRPRLIQPGDPVLRIRTDEDIESVTVLFPFGLVKPMTYLATERLWQTRFLAPASMIDGRYACRLILRDKEGRSYEEQKSFIIDSRPPRIQASLPQRTKAGQLLDISVQADSDTRTLHARFAGLPSATLKWSPEHKSNRGQIAIPSDCRPGYYDIQITAEDFAHNVSTLMHRIEIIR
jgi:Ca-activated chloride channel family protein